MNNFNRLVLVVFSFVVFVGCKTKNNTNTEDLVVMYKSPLEEIVIQNDTIIYTKITYEYSNPMSSVPSSTKFSTNKHKLSDSLKNLVIEKFEKSGFWQLNKEYGSNENERHYPYSIHCKIGTKEHSVVYRSNPTVEGAPREFSELEKFLHDLVVSFE